MTAPDKHQVLAAIAAEFDASRQAADDIAADMTAFLGEHSAAITAFRTALVETALAFANATAGDDNDAWKLAMRSATIDLQDTTVMLVGSLKEALGEPFSPARAALVTYEVAERHRRWWGHAQLDPGQASQQWTTAIAAAATPTPPEA